VLLVVAILEHDTLRFFTETSLAIGGARARQGPSGHKKSAPSECRGAY
jgi:hypothetical protein